MGRAHTKPFFLIATLLVFLAGAVAWADWNFGVSVEEGVSVMGGPLTYKMANPDGVTGASIDAVTSASNVSHSGGVHFALRKEGSGGLSLGLEYVHYRFDLDYEYSRINIDIVSLRLLVMADLVLLRFRDAPLISFGFGGYLELMVLDSAEISGSMLNVETNVASFGIVADFRITPFRFALPTRGTLCPSLFLRLYRGMLPQYQDELGSRAPLASATIGLGLSYKFP